MLPHRRIIDVLRATAGVGSLHPAVSGRKGARMRYALPPIVIALLAALPSSASAARVTQHRIDDGFSSPAIDTQTWFVGTNDPASVTIAQADGKLGFAVSGDAADGFGGGISTQCKAHGDFDAQVSFDLNQWPANNAVWVSLMAEDLGGVNTYRASVPDSEWYGGFFPPDGPAVRSTGTTRVERSAWCAAAPVRPPTTSGTAHGSRSQAAPPRPTTPASAWACST